MKMGFILFCFAGFLSLSAGENLIRNGDFNLYPDRAGDEYHQASSREHTDFDLFTEDLSWNKCGRLRILSLEPESAEGHRTIRAQVLIGADGTDAGFRCKPATLYRYTLQLRGNVTRAFLKGVQWKKGADPAVPAECEASRQTAAVGPEWSTVQGAFRTGPEADRAALSVSLWWSSQYKEDKHELKAGDHLLLDNVRIAEVKSILSADSEPDETGVLETVKSAPLILRSAGNAVTAEDPSWENVPPVTDFLSLTGRKNSPAEISFKAQSDGNTIWLLFQCRDPEGVTDSAANGLWYNDVIELFFAEPDQSGGFTQIAAGACGTMYVENSGKRAVPDVRAEVKTSKKAWQAFISIPVKSLYPQGLPKAGSRLGFNASLKRTKAGDYSSWNKVKTLRTVSQYGVLVTGGYGDGVTREEYEKKIAESVRAERQKKFEAFRESKTAVGILSVTSDYAVPMAAGLIEPVKEIRLKAAVNEICALPLAVANLDGIATEYRVTLETGDQGVFNGSYGLKDYPAEKIVTRVAVRTRDGDGCGGELFDPLPQINEASTVLIPAGECGVVWFDFDTGDMKPGVYTGILRVTPLNKKGSFPNKKGGGFHDRNYRGTRLEIPVTLEVRNIVLESHSTIPSQFFASNVEANDNLFAAGLELGSGLYSISPWALNFPLQQDDTFLPTAPVAQKKLGALRTLCGKYKVPFQFLVSYSAYETFWKLYGLKPDSEKAKKLWPQWIRALKAFMAGNGIGPDEFLIELFDEPGDMEEVIRVVTAAHEAWPELRIMLTLDARQGKKGADYKNRVKASDMRRLSEAVDTWILHRHYYFTDPEHLAFYREIRAKGKKVGHYTCETSPASQLHGNYRLFAWFGECYGLDLNSMYQLVEGIGYNGGVDFAAATAGNLLLAAGYQGAVIPTIRSMALRQGIMDVKYLALLRKIAGDSPEARAFLETAARKVVIDQRFNSALPDQVREEAARLILEIQKKTMKAQK